MKVCYSPFHRDGDLWGVVTHSDYGGPAPGTEVLLQTRKELDAAEKRLELLTEMTEQGKSIDEICEAMNSGTCDT